MAIGWASNYIGSLKSNVKNVSNVLPGHGTTYNLTEIHVNISANKINYNPLLIDWLTYHPHPRPQGSYRI